ncbi:MAG TPA: type IV pilin protein [Gammaproteobacteria bacterium]|nr:type IV pilin protein [Gammaproteobacteria bacterium]
MAAYGRTRGFTLLELMVVLAIIGILSMLAIPRYQRYVQKAHRSSAVAALSDLATQEEQYYLDNQAYTTSLGALHRSADAADMYTLSIPSATSNGYTVQAVAKTGTPQAGDKVNGVSCATLTLDSTGNRSPSQCWK